MYEILPLMLGANKVHLPLTFKEQRVGNCTKANMVAAFKVAVYFKQIEAGKSPEEAALEAKRIGLEFSVALRLKSMAQAWQLAQTSQVSNIKSAIEDCLSVAYEKVNRRLQQQEIDERLAV